MRKGGYNIICDQEGHNKKRKRSRSKSKSKGSTENEIPPEKKEKRETDANNKIEPGNRHNSIKSIPGLNESLDSIICLDSE